MATSMSPERRAVAAIVGYREKILLGKKKEESDGFLSGKWHIPGETLEEGENEEDGLKRGVEEEAGIKVRVLRYLGCHRTPKGTLVKWYECEPLTDTIRSGSDLSEVRWVSREEVAEMCSDQAKSLWPLEIWEYFL